MTRTFERRGALALARSASSELEARCRTSAADLIWLALAKHVLAVTHDALEGPDAGRPHHLRAAELAPGAWFANPGVQSSDTL